MAADAEILDQNYNLLAIADNYTSFIWVERYYEAGEFEIVMPFIKQVYDQVALENYIGRRDSERLMIIESIELESDNGSTMKISGRSIESILDRRVINEKLKLTGNLQNGIKSILDRHVINPTDSKRRIPNFEFVASTDRAITSLTVEAEFYGDTVYDAISAICEIYGIGFKILPNESNGGFRFMLYSGVDRTYAQTDRGYVVFSPEFGNLRNSRFYTDTSGYKNSAFVSTSPDSERIVTTESTTNAGATGLKRRETYVEVSMYVTESETWEDSDGKSHSRYVYEDSYYIPEMKTKGDEALADTSIDTAFDGEVDTGVQFVYNRDYFIGDIVQVVNEYGLEQVCRITEYALSSDSGADTAIPTFTTL